MSVDACSQCAIFVTGLTRASVRVLATPPPNHDSAVLPIIILTTLSLLLLNTLVSLAFLYRRHGLLIKWNPAGRHQKAAAVGGMLATSARSLPQSRQIS